MKYRLVAFQIVTEMALLFRIRLILVLSQISAIQIEFSITVDSRIVIQMKNWYTLPISINSFYPFDMVSANEQSDRKCFVKDEQNIFFFAK